MWRRRNKANGGASRATNAKAVRVALKAIGCVVVFVLLAAIVPFVNTAIGYVPVIAYLLTLLLCFAYLKVLKRGIAFDDVGVSGRCVRCEDLEFSLKVSNRSVLPVVRLEVCFYISDLFGGAGAVEVRNITLMGRQEKTFDFGVRFDHIGDYKVGIEHIDLGDPFGLFTSRLANGCLHDVWVEPKNVRIEDLDVSYESNTEAARKFRAVINDGMDYAGVREYRWGDPLKTIHWKLSARGEDYYTRLYEMVSNPGVCVVVDTESPEQDPARLMDVYDTIVESALAVVRFASASGMDSTLLFQGRQGEPERIVGAIDNRVRDIMRRLPLASTGEGEAALDLLRQEASAVHGHNNLVVCTSCLTDNLMDMLVGIRNRKRTPLLFAVVPAHLSTDARKKALEPLKRLAGSGVFYTVISASSDLEALQ